MTPPASDLLPGLPPGTFLMPIISRLGNSPRWSDVVIHAGVARWVEVAEDPSQDTAAQIAQVLAQIDATLVQINSDRTWLLGILIFLADLADAEVLNEQWDAWVPRSHPPIRACVQAGLSGRCRVEMVITAAVPE
jgi:enamine deaminase RidA (YjgF/YER057c/UK114 family)